MSNIKVYLRIRPENPENKQSEDQTEQTQQTNTNPFFQIEKKDNNDFLILNNEKKYFNMRKFAFEKIFEQDTDQQQLYSSLKGKLLDCAMNGVS